MKDDLRSEEKVPERRERLAIERIVGDDSLFISLRRVVRIESRSQDEVDD